MDSMHVSWVHNDFRALLNAGWLFDEMVGQPAISCIYTKYNKQTKNKRVWDWETERVSGCSRLDRKHRLCSAKTMSINRGPHFNRILVYFQLSYRGTLFPLPLPFSINSILRQWIYYIYMCVCMWIFCECVLFNECMRNRVLN